jgi:hypothetical protein
MSFALCSPELKPTKLGNRCHGATQKTSPGEHNQKSGELIQGTLEMLILKIGSCFLDLINRRRQ